jgi:hypothetical protein
MKLKRSVGDLHHSVLLWSVFPMEQGGGGTFGVVGAKYFVREGANVVRELL